MKMSQKRIRERAANIRAAMRPYSAEEIAQEVEFIRFSIRVHGISAFDNPMFIDRVRDMVTMGHTFDIPSDEEFIRIART